MKVLCAWYQEHFRAFQLTVSPDREVDLDQLTDAYPLYDGWRKTNDDPEEAHPHLR